jgi:acyl-CoA thioesterase-1
MKALHRWRASLLLAQVVIFALAVNLALALTFMPSYAGSSRPIQIVAFGDSLTAGFNLPPSQAFPVQLAKALKAKGHEVEIVNAGVSGDTTADGLARLDWAIGNGTEAVILELGANDALRGLPPKMARANLEKIIARLRERNIDVLIAGMLAPKNWGADYDTAFDAIYPELAAKHGLLLYPFFLDGVAMKSELNLNDGLHPTGKGVAVIVERILPSVEELIARVSARRLAASKS